MESTRASERATGWEDLYSHPIVGADVQCRYFCAHNASVLLPVLNNK